MTTREKKSSRYWWEVMGEHPKVLWERGKEKAALFLLRCALFSPHNISEIGICLIPLVSEYCFSLGGSFDVVVIAHARNLPLLFYCCHFSYLHPMGRSSKDQYRNFQGGCQWFEL